MRVGVWARGRVFIEEGGRRGRRCCGRACDRVRVLLAAGEFGPFMKLGEPEKGPGWKEQLAEKKAAAAAAARKADASYGGREVFDVDAATADELHYLSSRMNAVLQDPAVFPDPATRDWCACGRVSSK